MKQKIRSTILLMLCAMMVLTAVGCGNAQPTESWLSEVVVIGGDTDTSTSDVSADPADPEQPSSGKDKGSKDTGSTTTAAKGGKKTTTAKKKSSGSFKYDLKDLGGITMRRLVWYTPGTTESKMVSDFEKKYNCKIKDVYSVMEDMSTKMIAGMNSGDIIDISTLYGAFFPRVVIANLFEPIDEYVQESQLLSSKDPTAGGFDLDKMEHYVWGGHYYGFCSLTNCDLPILFYNKAIFTQYNQKTPTEYEKEGNWNWDTFYDVASAIKRDSGDTIAGMQTGSFLWFPAGGVQLITFKNGTPTSNLQDPKVLETMQFYKKCYFGNTALVKDNYGFFDGKAAMYLGIFSAIDLSKTSSKVKNNYAIASVPVSKNNTTGKYPASWSKAIGIGKGSLHPDAVATYARWVSNYVDAADALGQFTAAEQKQILGYFTNTLIPNATYGKTLDYAYGLQGDTKDKDPSAVRQSMEGLFAQAIKDTLSNS